jgi:hypothetical protein
MHMRHVSYVHESCLNMEEHLPMCDDGMTVNGVYMTFTICVRCVYMSHVSYVYDIYHMSQMCVYDI